MSVSEVDTAAMLDMARTLVEMGGTAVLFIGTVDPDGKNLVIPLDMFDNLPDHPTDRLAIVLQTAKESGLPRPPWVCFASDSYQQINANPNPRDPFTKYTDSDPEWHGRGTLQERFEAGAKNVSEAVVLTTMTGGGDLTLAITTYARTKVPDGDDVITFGDVVDWSEAMLDGAVPDLLREYFA